MNREIEELLEKAYPLENLENCRKKFVKRRLRNTVFAAIAILFFIIVMILRREKKGALGEDNQITRPDFGSRQIKLLAEYGDIARPVEFRLPARKRSKEEAEELIAQAAQLLKEHMLGENLSLQEVTGDLVLAEALPEYDIEIDWKTENRELISGDGSVHNEELKEKQIVTLTARIYYDGLVREYDYEVCVCPYPYTQEELLVRKLYEEFAICEEETAGQQYVKLPEELDGNGINWKEEENSPMGIFLLLGVVLIFAVYGRETSALRKKKKGEGGGIIN